MRAVWQSRKCAVARGPFYECVSLVAFVTMVAKMITTVGSGINGTVDRSFKFRFDFWLASYRLQLGTFPYHANDLDFS